jgi:hypothetical protein
MSVSISHLLRLCKPLPRRMVSTLPKKKTARLGGSCV